jgi:hypothetical protein
MKIEEIIDDLISSYNRVHLKKTWGETSLFFNPNEASSHGSYFLTWIEMGSSEFLLVFRVAPLKVFSGLSHLDPQKEELLKPGTISRKPIF